ncbi:HAD-IIA family hydrolase [Gordonia sp. CPCC 205333]|uniref:HAD-IIA family hydrolase n=1 Tax=Gordonia sp. CPCC 205333 TaxID=3140790 RepID=UPI003AF360E0
MTDSSRDRRGEPNRNGARDGRSGGRGDSGYGNRGRSSAGGRGDGGRGGRPGATGRGGPREGGRDRGQNTRGTVRADEPAIPDDVTAADLDPEVRRDLLSLDKTNAETVARHLVMVMNLLGEDPGAALAHARAARERAGRVGVVRETVGIAAYTAGEWQEALGELRTARRLTGSNALLPLIADSERGLGRPERAIDLARSAEGRALTGDEAAEMLIVESGARLDLGEPDKAVVTLQAANLQPGQTGDGPARLFYAYATALLAAGRRDDAATWFMNSAAADIDDVTDAELRLVELAQGDEPVEGGEVVTAEQADREAIKEPNVETEPADEVVAVSEVSVVEVASVADPTAEVSATIEAEPVAVEPLTDPEPRTGAQSAEETVAAPEISLASEYDALLLDLDGTVFAGSEALPGAVDALASVGVPSYYVTNNASRRAPDVAAHLTELGFDAVPEQVVTSAQAGAKLLAQHLPAGSRALVVGTDGLAQEVREVGIGVTRSADDRPDAVIQGHSTTTDWAILSEAVLAINNGALWVACNVDPTLPSERGLMIGNGSMVAAVQNATGKQPLVAGKPAAPLMADAIERSASKHPLVVGDRLDTDIEGAVAVGVDSLLVLTGVSGAADLLVAAPEQRPTYVVDDLRGLLDSSDIARIGAQPGWTVSAGTGTGEVRVDVAATPDALDAALLPALAAAIWSAVDAHLAAAPEDGLAVTIATEDERVRGLLDTLGVR